MKTTVSIACASALAVSECYARQLSPTDLRVMAAGVMATNPNPHDIPPSVLVAFAMVESTGRPTILGDHGKAWGLFQFHVDRWNEVAHPSDYGHADPVTQTRAMFHALTRYFEAARRHSAKNRLVFAANAHHDGTGSDGLTPYARKILAAVEQAEKE